MSNTKLQEDNQSYDALIEKNDDLKASIDDFKNVKFTKLQNIEFNDEFFLKDKKKEDKFSSIPLDDQIKWLHDNIYILMIKFNNCIKIIDLMLSVEKYKSEKSLLTKLKNYIIDQMIEITKYNINIDPNEKIIIAPKKKSKLNITITKKKEWSYGGGGIVDDISSSKLVAICTETLNDNNNDLLEGIVYGIGVTSVLTVCSGPLAPIVFVYQRLFQLGL